MHWEYTVPAAFHLPQNELKSRIGNILPQPTSNTFGLRQNELKTAFLEDFCVGSSVPLSEK
jgi:hypothetical protein